MDVLCNAARCDVPETVDRALKISYLCKPALTRGLVYIYIYVVDFECAISSGALLYLKVTNIVQLVCLV